MNDEWKIGDRVWYPATIFDMDPSGRPVVGIDCKQGAWFELPSGYDVSLLEIMDSFPVHEVLSALSAWVIKNQRHHDVSVSFHLPNYQGDTEAEQ
jgi:hypothetical protein